MSPVSERTPLLRLVDALTTGARPEALLVQVEQDWAALALTPSGVLLVVLDARVREPWDVIGRRASAVMRTEQPEVLSGLLPNMMVVLLLGGRFTADDLATAPQQIPELGRWVHWVAAEPSGGVVADERSVPSVPHSFFAGVHRTLQEALHRAPQNVGPAARQVIERFGESALASEARFRGTLGSRVRPYTAGLLAACVVMFVLQRIVGEQTFSSLAHMGALSPRYVRAGHYEVLLSYSMLHGGLLHIVMNGLALNSIGTLLENLIGGRRMLFVFTLSALGGGIAVAAFGKFDMPVVGASGGIFGLLTALLGLALRSSDLPPLARARLRRGIWSTLLLNLFISLLPGVSLLGHAGGALVGVVLGASGVLTRGVPLPWRGAPDPKVMARMDGLFRVVGVCCVLALAGSVVIAWLRGQPWN